MSRTAAGQRLKEPLLLPEDDLADDEEQGKVRAAAHTCESGAVSPPLAGATARGRSDVSPGCFSIFAEARRYTRQHISALSRAAGDGCREALMFPAMARFGSVPSMSLKAFDVSFSNEDVDRANGAREWVGARLLYALREAAQGVRFPHRAAAALGLYREDENYRSYYSRRHRLTARGGEGLVVCLPMRISEISSSGRTRERTDLNQLDLLRECFRRIKRPPTQLTAILHHSPEFADLCGSNSRSGHGNEERVSAGVDGDASSFVRPVKDIFYRLTPLELSAGRQRVAGTDCRARALDASIEEGRRDLQRLALGDFRALQPLGDAEILVREGAVVVGLDPVRAVITASRLYVVVPPGDDKVLQQLQDTLWKAGAFRELTNAGREDVASARSTAAGFWLGVGKGRTFQEVALGAVFTTVLDFYVEQVRLLAYTSVSVWNSVRWRVSSADLNKLLLLRVRMEDMLRQVEGVHLVVEALHAQVDPLHAHERLGFNLEDGSRDLRASGDGVGVQEVAWLLEEHMGEIGVLRTYLNNILEELEDMRVLLQFQLLCSQNKLLRAEVGFQMATCWICAGCLVGCVFGMNFHNGFESSHAGPSSSVSVHQASPAGAGMSEDPSSVTSVAARFGIEDPVFRAGVGRGGVSGAEAEGSHVAVSWIWLQVVVGTTLGSIVHTLSCCLLAARDSEACACTCARMKRPAGKTCAG